MSDDTMTVALTLHAPVLIDGDVKEQATALTITGDETMELAVELREGIRDLLKEIDAGYRPHIQRAHDLHKGLCAELNTRSAGPKEALAILNDKMARYELARRAAEEREKRLIAEAQAKAAAAAREAEAQAAAVVSPEQAADVRAMPLEAFTQPSTAVTTTPAKAKGVAVTLTYEAEMTDLMALAQFALANPPLLAVLIGPNMDGLNLLVKQQGDTFAIPGVRRVPKTPVVRATARR